MTPASRPRLPVSAYAATAWPLFAALLIAFLSDATSWALPDRSTMIAVGVVVAGSAAFLAVALRASMAPLGVDPRMAEALEKALAALDAAQSTLARHRERLQEAGPADGAPPAPAARARVDRRAWAGIAAVVIVAVLLAPQLPMLSGANVANPVHHHAAIVIFVDGERLRFQDGMFDVSERGYMRAHLHAPIDDVIHIEGPDGVTLLDFASRTLGWRWNGSEVLMPRDAGELRLDMSTRALRVFVHDGQDWALQPISLGYAPREHDRILVDIGPVRDIPAGDFDQVRDAFPTA